MRENQVDVFEAEDMAGIPAKVLCRLAAEGKLKPRVYREYALDDWRSGCRCCAQRGDVSFTKVILKQKRHGLQGTKGAKSLLGESPAITTGLSPWRETCR